jgi:hypothetical protein
MKNKLNFKQVMMAGLTAAAVSAIINALLFFIFHAMGLITDDIFPQPNQPMTVVPVIFSSIIPTLIASIVFFLFEKYTQIGFKIFSIVTIILMLLSLGGPFAGIPNATTVYALSLSVMHFVVPLSLLYFINKSKKSNNA